LITTYTSQCLSRWEWMCMRNVLFGPISIPQFMLCKNFRCVLKVRLASLIMYLPDVRRDCGSNNRLVQRLESVTREL
jgi:hypothetical protein